MLIKKYRTLIHVSYEDEQYFYMRNISEQAGNFSVSFVKDASMADSSPWTNVEYSTDGVNWVSYDLSTKPTIEVPSGRNIYLRGDGGATAHYDHLNKQSHYEITMDVDHAIGGNILSLIDKTNFKTMTTYSKTYVFRYLFKSDTHLIDASKLNFGQISSLTDSCYYQMFYYCSALTSAPALPATTLANNCYNQMFYYCSALTSAPALPATTLAQNCYDSMFRGCTGLTAAPELPATTLAQSCYSNMLNGCTGLTAAPALPATTLANNCYYQMFYNCIALNTIKCLATDISATQCTGYWVQNVPANNGTFYKSANMSGWTTGNSGIPSGWTVVDY